MKGRLALLVLALSIFSFLAPLTKGVAHAGSAPYTVSGNKILNSDGSQFIPYGIQMVQGEFASSGWQTSGQTNITQAVVDDARSLWYANTTRIQVSSANFLSTSGGTTNCTDAHGHVYAYNTALGNRLDQIVGWADAVGMNTIITAQYEGTTNQPMPTQDTINYWHAMACHYENNQRVFFDIFNEPRAHQVSGYVENSDGNWSFWHDGGVGTDGVTYVGMQAVANAIRTDNGANNLIFAEGSGYGGTIQYLYCTAADCGGTSHNHTLSGSNIVYAVHPYLGTNDRTQSQWESNFGDAAATGNFPVVADEWGESQVLSDCYTDAPTGVDSFLSYLSNVVDLTNGASGVSMGLIGFTYYPGRMNEEWDITSPTFYTGSTTTCATIDPFTSTSVQGAGQKVQAYFKQHGPSVAGSPNPVQPLTNLTVTGYDFGASEVVKVYLDSTTSTAIATPTSDGAGAFASTVTLAKNYGGAHSLIAVGQTTGVQATSTLTFSPIEILNPTSGHVGATVAITDSGFGPNEVINAYWEPANTLLGSATTGPLGSLTSPNTINFNVPSTSNGAYTVKSVGQTSGDVATATFTVN